MASSKEVWVRAHKRLIFSREYGFGCAECNRATKRESFGPRPRYCLTCRPPKPPKTNTSLQIAPQEVEVAVEQLSLL